MKYILIAILLSSNAVFGAEIIAGSMSTGLIYEKELNKYSVNVLGTATREFTLLENTDQCLINCEAIIKVTLNTPLLLPNSKDANFDLTYIKQSESMTGLKDLRIEIYNYTYRTEIIEYREVNCITEIKNINGTSITTRTCDTEAITKVIKEENLLHQSLFAGVTLQKGEYLFKIKGTKNIQSDERGLIKPNNIDWIPKIQGYSLDRWAWWNNSWTHRRPLNFRGTNQTDFQIFVNVTYDSNMQTDFDDLRILNASENQELPYWIEYKSNSNYADVWFKGNFTTVNQTQAYVYYGNPTASTTSNINSTMEDGDDFEGQAIETNKFRTTIPANQFTMGSRGVLNVSDDSTTTNGVISVKGFSLPIIIEFVMNRSDVSGDVICGRTKTRSTNIANDESTNGYGYICQSTNTANEYRSITTSTSSSTTGSISGVNDNAWHKFKMNGTTSAISYVIDGTIKSTLTTNIPTGATNMSWQSGDSANDHYIDYYFVRKYNESDIIASLGSEATILEVNIISPSNATTLNNTALLQFNVTGNITTYSCWRNLDNNITSISNVGNNSLFNQTMENLFHGTHYVNVTCQNNGINRSTSVIGFTTLHFNITVFNNPASVYETEIANFNITIDAISNISDITRVDLIYNNSANLSSRFSKSGTTYGYRNIFEIPLVNNGTANNASISFFYNISLLYVNGSTTTLASVTRSHSVFQLEVVNCTSSQTTQTINFTMRNEESVNSLIIGDMVVAFDLWKGSGTVKRQIGFNSTNSTTHAFCITPNNQTVTADVLAQYESAGFSNRTYFIVKGTLNNVTQRIDLYLLSNSLSTLTIITVRDYRGLVQTDTIIKMLRFYAEENVFRLVTMGRTGSEGKAIVNIRLNTPFHRILIEKDGVLKHTETSQQISGDITVTIPKGAELIYDIIGKVSRTCTANETSKVISCTYSDSSGFVGTYNLSVYKQGATQQVQVCSSQLTDASATILCDLSTQTNGTYFWSFRAIYSDGSVQIVKTGTLELGRVLRFGESGIFLGLMIFLVLALIGTFDPRATMIFGSLGLIMGQWLQILPVTLASVMSMVFLAIIAIIKVKSRF